MIQRLSPALCDTRCSLLRVEFVTNTVLVNSYIKRIGESVCVSKVLCHNNMSNNVLAVY